MTVVQRSAIAQQVVGCAIEVHRRLGPGLLESTYHRCLAREMSLAGIAYESEVVIPVIYKGTLLDCGYRVDLVADKRLLVEIKSVDHLLPIHSAQVMTYLRLSTCEQAFLFNFNVERLKDGMKSFLRPRGALAPAGDA